jgi:hypothetical protein
MGEPIDDVVGQASNQPADDHSTNIDLAHGVISFVAFERLPNDECTYGRAPSSGWC